MMPPPNLPSASKNVPNNNYLGAADVAYNRLTSDSKIDWVASEKFRMNGHLGLAKYNTLNPQIFAVGGPEASGFIGNEGTAYGHTISFSVTGSYVATPTFVVDAIFGMTRMVANSQHIAEKTVSGFPSGRRRKQRLLAWLELGSLHQINVQVAVVVVVEQRHPRAHDLRHEVFAGGAVEVVELDPDFRRHFTEDRRARRRPARRGENASRNARERKAREQHVASR
jgi:hypothetical protein